MRVKGGYFMPLVAEKAFVSPPVVKKPSDHENHLSFLVIDHG